MVAADTAQEIDEVLFLDHNVHQILQGHLLDNFIEASEQQIPYQGHFQQEAVLEDYELDLFKEIIWLMANLANQSAIGFAFATDRLAEQLYLVTSKFHKQFNFTIWRILLWIFRMLSHALENFEENMIDMTPQYNLLQNYHDQISSYLLDSEDLENMMVRDQMRKDYIFFVATSFIYFNEEEKQYFTKAPYNFAVTLATLLKEMQNPQVDRQLVRVLGDLISDSDEVCSYLICQRSQDL